MSSIWKTLGIKAGRDQIEIRRAYGRKLRLTHPEDDPEGFKRLREAYETALYLARQAAEVEVLERDDEEEEKASDAAAEAAPPAPAMVEVPAPEQQRVVGVGEIAHADLCNRLGALLAQDVEPAQELLQEALKAILASPALEAMATHQRTESWLAGVISGGLPRADALIEPAAAYFRWEEEGPASSPGPLLFARRAEFAHAALCNRLGALLLPEAEASTSDLDHALNAVLSSPGLDSMAIYQRTEAWLAQLITGNVPRSDALIDTAIGFFDWSFNRFQGAGAGEAVLARKVDLDFRRELRRSYNDYHQAYQSLRRRPTIWRRWRERLQLGLSAQVAELLQILDSRHPSLIAELDPDAVSRWRKHGAGPVYSAGYGWTAIALTPTVGGIIAASEALGKGWWTWPAGSLITLAIVLLIQAGILYGVEWPRTRWRQEHAWRAGAGIRLGWAPLQVLVLVLAAALPASLPLALALGAFAWGGLIWAYIVAEPVAMRRRWQWWRRFLFANLWLVLYWIFVARNGLGVTGLLQFGLVLFAAMFAFAAGEQSLIDAWIEAPAPLRRATLVASGIGAAVTPLILWRGAPETTTAGLGVAMTVVLALLVHTPCVLASPQAIGLYNWAMRASWIFWSILLSLDGVRQANSTSLAGGLWQMTGVAVIIVSALRAERSQRPPAPA